MEEAVPAELRRDRMLTLVRDREFVRVADLSSIFGISEVTVRADLAHLAELGYLQRVHGGAIVRDPGIRLERTFEEAMDESSAEKDAIGTYAAGTVRSGETIILDVGTSAAAVARALVHRTELIDVTVFTSSLPIALALEGAIPRITVVVTGGTLRPQQHSLVDPMGGFVFENIHVATAFLGCNGVHPQAGITNVNLPEAEMKRKMVAAAQRTVVVADGSKIGNISVAKVAEITDIDQVVTGPSAPPQAVAGIQRHGVEVNITEPEMRA